MGVGAVRETCVGLMRKKEGCVRELCKIDVLDGRVKEREGREREREAPKD